jgi:formyl-CoA transferase
MEVRSPASRRYRALLSQEQLNKVGVPCGPINTIDQTFAGPQVEHLGIAKSVSHPTLEPQKVVGQPIHLSRYPQPNELRPTPIRASTPRRSCASLATTRVQLQGYASAALFKNELASTSDWSQ